MRTGAVPASALYVRHVNESMYRALSIPGRKTTQEHPVCGVVTPTLFFVVLQWHKYRDTWGADEGCVHHIDLRSEVETAFMTSSDIELPQECRRAWFGELVSVDDSRNELICSICYDYGPARPGNGIECWLCHIDIRSRAMNNITELKDTFL
jgi:hypothetical protein